MKRKYRMGFSGMILLFVILISAAYRWSYLEAEKDYTSRQLEKSESYTTEGEIKKNTGYYLDELHGFVVVYMSDRKTVYETTAISMDMLPEDLQTKIRNGLYIDNAEELYQFLENYSS